MANRYMPFGYEIADGEIRIIEREAEAVKNIFNLYVQGESLKNIQERLNITGISYASDGRDWDKNMVKRILDNKKYIGDKGYPVIIPPETFELAKIYKGNKVHKLDEKTKERLDAYHNKARCGICEGMMIRRHSCSREKRKIFWKCGNPDCEGHKHVLNQDRFDTMMARLLNDIAADIEIIKTDYTALMEEKPEISQKTRDVKNMIESTDTEMGEGVSQITELAELWFKHCKTADNSAVTTEIENTMAMYPKSDKVDGKIVNQIIKTIKIMPDKSATITLINGKIFERQA